MTDHLASLVGTDVDVYWNLHKGAWSVRDRKTRLVVARVDRIVLKDVKFVVSAAGNARVRAEGRKNVHAFARGTLLSVANTPYDVSPRAETITYNPYRFTTFVEKHTERPVHRAAKVSLGNRTVHAFDIA